jgi:hypothetical protein
LRQPFETRYRLEGAGSRRSLDLSGFQNGPLKDRTLHCLVELNGEDGSRIDYEPGDRPQQLDPQQTQVFVRVVANVEPSSATTSRSREKT